MNGLAPDAKKTVKAKAAIRLLFVICCYALWPAGLAFGDSPVPQLVRLADGRWLEYAEYGTPSGPLVLYFHGTPGSHLEVYAASREIDASGIHIIALNRPGIGNSSYQCGRKIMDLPKDVSEFLEVIGRGDERFGIVGFSGGAPYAFACARAMPDRITRVAIVSGHTSLGVPGVVPGIEDRSMSMLIRRPSLAKKAVEVTMRRLDRKPDKVVARVSKKWDPNDRRLIASDPLIRGLLVGSLKQVTLRGEQGVVTDAQLLGRSWGFRIAEVCGPPISIWHGQCDRIAPVSMGQYFHSQLPASTLHVDPDAGHITMFKWHCEEIHREFAEY